MAITSYGYNGPITEPQMSQIVPNSGSAHYGVVGAGDWKVTAGSNAGQVNIAPGTGWGPALVDVSDAIVSLTQPDLPSGSGATRWDLVAMRRDWQPPTGGQSQFVILKGTTDKQLPAAAAAPGDSSSTQRMVFPGQIEDQPVALLQWTAGYSKPTQIIDLRVWAANGGAYAVDTLVTTFLNQVGTSLRIGTDEWVLGLDANGSPAWTNLDAPGPWVKITEANDWKNAIGQCRKVARGAILEVDLETVYTGKLTTESGWFIGKLPAGSKPTAPQLKTALTGDNFAQSTTVWIGPNDIQIAPPSAGKRAFKVQTTVALR